MRSAALSRLDAQVQVATYTQPMPDSIPRQSIAELMAAAGVGIWRWDPPNNAVFWDDTTHEIYGTTPGLFDGTFESFVSFVHPEDAEGVQTIIGAVATRGGEFTVKHRIVQPSGSVRWVEGQGRIVTEGGAPVQGFGIVYDVTDRATLEDERDRLRLAEQAAHAAQTATEQDLAFLIEVSDALTRTFNPTRIAERLATFVVPKLADRCVVDLQSDGTDGSTLSVVCGADGLAASQSVTTPDEQLQQRLQLPLGHLGREGLDQLVPPMARAAGAAGIAIPLVLGGNRRGTLLAERDDGHWAPRTEALLAAIARRAAVATEHAFLFQAQSTVMELLIRTNQPDHVDSTHAFELATYYRAAAEVASLGGDFYDVIELDDDRWLMLVGDVAGKGIMAATRAGLMRASLRAAARTTGEPLTMIETLNQLLRAEPDAPMATLAVVVFESVEGGLEYEMASAGHPPAVLISPNGDATEIETKGVLLGFTDRIDLVCARGTVPPGFTLMLYTDGVIEARLGDAMLGIEGMLDALRPIAAGGAAAITRAVASTVESWTAGRLRDDVTILSVTSK